MSKAGAFLRHFFSKDAEPDMVPNRELLSYSAGLAGQNISYSFLSNWLQYFYINIMGVDSKRVGRMFLYTHVWDALNDPLIGSLIDKRRFRSGEKLRPFLLYLPPIIGAVTALMFTGVSMGSETGNLIYMMVIYLIWDVIYSVQDVALWGMVSNASPDSNERGRVAQWVSIGAAAGSAFASAFGFLRGMLLNAGLDDRWIFTIFGILFGFGGQLLSMRAHKIKERVISPAKENETFRETMRLLFLNKKLLIISLARILGNLYPRVGIIYFFENCMSVKVFGKVLDGNMMFTLVPMLAGIPGALSMFFANRFAIRVGGMKKLLFLAKAIEFICRVLSFFIGLNSGYNVVWRLLIIILLNGVMNIPTGMMDIAHRALTSDGIDEVEAKTGKRSEGVAFSTQNFVSKLNDGITKLIEGYMLSWLQYDAKKKTQNALFLKWQWPMYILSPAIGAVLYLIAICFIKDDRTHQKVITEKLALMRQAVAESESVDPS